MIHDVSQSISPALPVWPGDPSVTLVRLPLADDGASVSALSLGSHAGTHVDAPSHYLPGGAAVDDLPLEALVGEAWVAYLPAAIEVGASLLGASGVPEGTTRLLLRTRNSDRATTGFEPDYVSLAPDAAPWLLARGIRLLGMDGPSVDAAGAPGAPVHHALLSAGVVIVEGLRLGAVEAGKYWLACLPLRLKGADGAPARAILMDGKRAQGMRPETPAAAAAGSPAGPTQGSRSGQCPIP